MGKAQSGPSLAGDGEGHEPAVTIIKPHPEGMGEPVDRAELADGESDVDEDIIMETSPRADPAGEGKPGSRNRGTDAPPAGEA